jgi:transposase-like protein
MACRGRKNAPAGNEAGNVRNGSRPKTVLTEATGQVQVEVPRDREGTFEPQIVRKRQRRLSGVDEMVLSLYAKGLTTGCRGSTRQGSGPDRPGAVRVAVRMVVEKATGYAA